MTTKHTHGPWNIGEKTIFTDSGFKVYGYPISAGGQAIARVHAGSVGKEGFSFGNQEANARLIALAPEMAEQLQLTQADLDVLADSDSIHDWQEVCAKMAQDIRAILAKLEG